MVGKQEQGAEDTGVQQIMALLTGSYTGSDGFYRFEVRFERRDELVPSRGMHALSGDVFSGNVPLFSFIMTSGTLSEDEKVVSGTLSIMPIDGLHGARVGTVTATSLSDDPVSIQYMLVNLDILSPSMTPVRRFVFTVARYSLHLRTVELEIDLERGKSTDPIAEPGMFRETGIPGFTASVESSLNRVGIGVVSAGTRDLINSDPNADGVWTEGELQSVMEAKSQNRINQRSWRVYLLVAGEFRTVVLDRRTTGIMFDLDSVPRQGAAVFYYARRASSKPEFFQRDFIRTAVHEIGHVFNLLHTFDENKRFGPRYGSHSFMNYPQKFAPASNPETEYWRQFSWSFDLEEAEHLRHGRLDDVIMGGRSFGMDGPGFESQGGGFSFERAGSSQGGCKLQLRLSPKDRSRIFKFGEPVVIESKLMNLLDEPRELSDTLAPCHKQTQYLIEGPSGRIWTHRPMSVRCSEDRTRTIGAVTSKVEETAIYESVNLSFDASGFSLIDPGRYRIQAIYYAGDMRLYSNIETIHVGFPDPRTEKEIAPLLTDDVAKFLGLWGTPSGLAKADSLFGDIFDPANPFTHPLIDEYARCKFYLLDGGFREVDRENGALCRRMPRIEDDLIDHLRSCLQISKGTESLLGSARRGTSQKSRADSSFSNIIYGLLSKKMKPHIDSQSGKGQRFIAASKAYLDIRGLPHNLGRQFV